MKNYQSLTPGEARAEYERVLSVYRSYKDAHLSLDLSRGKPNSEQLDMSQALLETPLSRDMCFTESGFDLRNYGLFDGVPKMKALFSDLFGIPVERIFVGGNSALQLIYDTLMRAMVFGTPDSDRPWGREDGLKWICVAPGYDRHFRIAETLGFELLTVPMRADGPDMDLVEKLVADPKVKGIFCVPKYSNPSGNTYSEETVRRLVSMNCAAKDFRIVWDNAYGVHDFDPDHADVLPDVFALAKEAGTEDRVLYYTSTSKISFPGAGVAMMAMSEKNLADAKKKITVATIGYDKLNQIRHLAYFESVGGVREHMKILGRNVGRKMNIAFTALADLDGLGIAEYTKPRGGYFISLDTLPGCAKKTYELVRAAGVTLTDVGATYPYGIDPEDKNLRLAPTYPSDEQLDLAVRILAVAIRIAALEKLFPEVAR